MIDDSFKALININNLIEQALNLSNRAKISIEQVENEISITKEK